jgi:competence protein ComEC
MDSAPLSDTPSARRILVRLGYLGALLTLVVLVGVFAGLGTTLPEVGTTLPGLGTTLPEVAQDPPLYVTFLDVGQGDAVLITSPEGKRALIDAGPGADLGPALARWGVDSLDLVIASHPHADHIGGMTQVLGSRPVRFYMDNGQPHTTRTYEVVMKMLQDRPEITYLEAVPRTLQLGSVTLRVLPMPPDPGSNLNNRSVGIIVEYGSFSAFLSGDSERLELQHFVSAQVVPDVTLLKAPHHGSNNGMTESFLNVAAPEVVVISVGSENDYGHPMPIALGAYARFSDQVLRTDRDGEVVVAGYADGRYELFTGDAAHALRWARAGVGADGSVEPTNSTTNSTDPAVGADRRKDEGRK